MANTIVLWTIAVLLALLFLYSALPKLQAGDAMKQRFADWGTRAKWEVFSARAPGSPLRRIS